MVAQSRHHQVRARRRRLPVGRVAQVSEALAVLADPTAVLVAPVAAIVVRPMLQEQLLELVHRAQPPVLTIFRAVPAVDRSPAVRSPVLAFPVLARVALAAVPVAAVAETLVLSNVSRAASVGRRSKSSSQRGCSRIPRAMRLYLPLR